MKKPVPLIGEYTEEEVKIQAVFEAQLRHTVKEIESALGDHPHFTDDCGDYLFAALDLSAQLQSLRMDGIDGFEDRMKELLIGSGDDDLLLGQFASDGIAPEIYEWAKANGWKEDLG